MIEGKLFEFTRNLDQDLAVRVFIHVIVEITIIGWTDFVEREKRELKIGDQKSRTDLKKKYPQK